MIAALFALAAAMVIGGCAAVIQGFPYVRLESGLAMVIAGSVAASSGAVLLGLGVVAAGLRRVERAAGRIPSLQPEAGESPAPASESRPRMPPVLPPAPAFVVPPVVAPPSVELPFDPGRLRIEPDRRAQETRDSENGAFAAPTAADVEPELPIPGLTPPAPEPPPHPEPEAPPEPAHDIAPEDDLFAAPEAPAPEADAQGEPPALRPSLDAAPEAEPEPEPEIGRTAAERTVVGRYASGGNTYLMFADGSIEADTPQGRFTFASLDELKAFVDGGGEAGTRGAA